MTAYSHSLHTFFLTLPNEGETSKYVCVCVFLTKALTYLIKINFCFVYTNPRFVRLKVMN